MRRLWFAPAASLAFGECRPRQRLGASPRASSRRSGAPAAVPVPPSVPRGAGHARLVVDLSQARVSITSAFRARTSCCSACSTRRANRGRGGQGPPTRETVLRKERVLGLWLNTGRQAFDDVPAYYAVAATQPLQRLLARGAGGEILSLEDRLASVRSVGCARPNELSVPPGLIEVKRREGLYPAAIGQVTVQAGRLFRVDLQFPSRLPEGVYEVRTYLLRDGRIVAAVSRPLPVGKVGFSAQLAGWAAHEGALYGLGAIVMALLWAGCGGAVMRRI